MFLQDYLAENQWPVWTCLLISFALLFTIVCFPKTHKFPFDYMLLFGFTIFFSVCVAAITGRCACFLPPGSSTTLIVLFFEALWT